MYAPDVKALMESGKSPLSDVMIRMHEDSRALSRRYPVTFSPATCREFAVFYTEWERELNSIDYESLDVAGRVDYHLLIRRISAGRLQVARSRKLHAALAPWVPFAAHIIRLVEARIAFERLDPRETGRILEDVAGSISECRSRLAGVKADAFDAANLKKFLEEIKRHLEGWHKEAHGYDPELTWWIEKPHERVKEFLDAYLKSLSEDIMGEKEGAADAPIVATPMGHDAVVALLANEYICYTPEALFDMAEKELTLCENEMAAVAGQMGYRNDRGGALDHIKSMHGKPGDQPYVVKELADEAIAFLDQRNLVTIPEHARRIWRQTMISPDLQKGSHTFLWGGETIGTSYSHKIFTHEQKLTSMRSNCIPFLKATVHHELIPGHHLMMYMNDRFGTHRRGYGTPFLGEGWPLYWELLLYKLGFASAPEDKYGFLFWRMHRCARIMIVLGFHIGKLSIQDCLDLVIKRVGHDTHAGTSQVRWLVAGDLALYGAAYMLGGLQLLGLRAELVDSGKMTDREFHDRILKVNLMPIYLVRAILTGHALARDEKSGWLFYDRVVESRG